MAKRKKRTTTTLLLWIMVFLGVVLAGLLVAFVASENVMFVYAAIAVLVAAIIPMATLARQLFTANGDEG